MAGVAPSRPRFKDGQGPPGNWRSWLIWSAAALFYLHEFIVRICPSIMEHELQSAFDMGAGPMGAALGAYFYVYAPMQIVVGLALDKFGVRRLLVPASAAVAAGCLLMVVWQSPASLWISRILMGLGSSFAAVAAFHIATVWFPANRLAMLTGLTTTVGSIGAIFGQAPLVALMDATDWQTVWMFCAVLGAVLTFYIWMVIPPPPPWVAERGSGDAIAREERTLMRGLKLVLRNPQTWIIGSIGMALYLNVALFGALWGNDYVMVVTGGDKMAAAAAISALYVGWLVGSPLAGAWSDWAQRRKMPLVVGLCLNLVLTCMLLWFDQMTVGQMSALLFALGVVSSPQVITFVANVEHNPAWASGTALAVNNMLVMLVGGIGQPVVGYILQARGGSGPGVTYSPEDFHIALVVMPVISVIALIASIFLRESHPLNPANRDAYETLADA